MSAQGRDGLIIKLDRTETGAYALIISRDGNERTEKWSTLDKAIDRAAALGATSWELEQ